MPQSTAQVRNPGLFTRFSICNCDRREERDVSTASPGAQGALAGSQAKPGQRAAPQRSIILGVATVDIQTHRMLEFGLDVVLNFGILRLV
ncbi:hypothetical protein N7528_007542 [Penicillium herquei]|nr:hypothetical protein N7528_007542 [Penicillium herquei]